MVKPVSDGNEYTRGYQQALNDFGITDCCRLSAATLRRTLIPRAHESAIKKLQSSVCLRELTPQLHSTLLLLVIRLLGLLFHFLLAFSGCLLQNEC